MNKIGTILYATDFSESSEPAANWAKTLARLAGSRIHVLHVIGELADQRRSQIQVQAFEVFEKNIEVHVVKEMEEFCRKHFEGELEYTTEIVIGRPFQEIMKTAAAIGADLIVMGTHGRTGIEHVLVGSTAERVVRRSSIPVLTVRSIEQPTGKGK